MNTHMYNMVAILSSSNPRLIACNRETIFCSTRFMHSTKSDHFGGVHIRFNWRCRSSVCFVADKNPALLN